MTTQHAMIDLETLDTSASTAVLSIGIVKFDPRTGTGDKFYRRLGYDQASLFGTVSDSTLQWWSRQDAAVRLEAFTAEHEIYQSAIDLVQFMSGVTRVWGNGATFDIPIIENWLTAYRGNTPPHATAGRLKISLLISVLYANLLSVAATTITRLMTLFIKPNTSAGCGRRLLREELQYEKNE